MIILLSVVVLTGCETSKDRLTNGLNQLKAQEYEEAKATFEGLIANNDYLAESYRGLGIIAYQQGDYEAAADAFEKVIENEGAITPELQNLIGTCYMKLMNYEKALEVYQEGIKAVRGEGDKEKALTDLSETDAKLLQEMYFNEVACYEYLGDWASAEAKATVYRDNYPDDEKMRRELEFIKTR
jgi:tetratricopeptide (TPR) repeat protein